MLLQVFISILNQTPKQVKHDCAHMAKSTLFTAHLTNTSDHSVLYNFQIRYPKGTGSF
jgi:hypothetical protein